MISNEEKKWSTYRAWIIPGTQPRMVKQMLISRSAPQPRSRKTPRGGRMMAKMILQISLWRVSNGGHGHMVIWSDWKCDECSQITQANLYSGKRRKKGAQGEKSMGDSRSSERHDGGVFLGIGKSKGSREIKSSRDRGREGKSESREEWEQGRSSRLALLKGREGAPDYVASLTATLWLSLMYLPQLSVIG